MTEFGRWHSLTGATVALVAALVCACSPASAPPSSGQQEASAVDAAPSLTGPWAAVFQRPDKLIDATNDHGFQNAPFHSARAPPPEYISTGTLVSLTDIGRAVMPNNTGLYVYGSASNRADEFRLKLNVNEPRFEREAKQKYLEIVSKVFTDLELSGFDKFKLAVEAGVEGRTSLADVDLLLQRQSQEGGANPSGAYSLIAIILRPGAEPSE